VEKSQKHIFPNDKDLARLVRAHYDQEGAGKADTRGTHRKD
jgi:hypothetical protein